jgi:CHAT domain-containing protein
MGLGDWALSIAKRVGSELAPILDAKVISLPPHRVDVTYDCEPFSSGENYARLWLCEVQHHANDKDHSTGHLIFSTTQFNYGTKSLRIPALVAPPSLGAAGSQGSTSARFTLNRPLTPLFPYLGGEVQFVCSLFRVESGAETGFTRVLEGLATILSSPGFSTQLHLAGLLQEGFQNITRNQKSRLELGCYQTFSEDRAIASIRGAFAYGRLTPGYFAVLRHGSRVGKIDVPLLCVVDSSLRLGAPKDFRSENQPLPPEEAEYLLFRIEKQAMRNDWNSFGAIEDLMGEAADAARQDKLNLVRDVFKRIASEVHRSHDLTKSDKQRVIEALLVHFRKVAGSAGARPVSEVEKQDITENSVRTLSTAISVDLKKEGTKEEQRRQAAEQVTASSPFPDENNGYVLSLEYNPGAPLRLEISEGNFGILHCQIIPKVDVSSYARRSDKAFADDDWRSEISAQGKELSNELLSDPLIWETYKEVRGSDRDLHLRFRCPQAFFRVPLEFLPTKDLRDHLVLKHPFSRSVVGDGVPMTKREPLCPKFFNQIYRLRQPLSILLIASNTPPDLPRVDQEVEALATSLQGLFKTKKLEVQINALMSERATFDVVREELRSGKYHIIHYAGHGVYDRDSPDESYLPLWELRGQKGTIKPLKVPALKWALDESRVRFVYLSCCAGAAQAQPEKLQDNDFLGITDGLLRAGVPSILSYRWPLVDSGGEKLARAFYKYLAQEGRIDTALLFARREVSEDRQDRSWLSPVLIMQA